MGFAFVQKIIVYLQKQRIYKCKLRNVLFSIKPDITVSLMRREINFITSIKDGSKKVGELHINKKNYRNFKTETNNFFKKMLSTFWSKQLIHKLQKLDQFIVLTQEDKEDWKEVKKSVSFLILYHFTRKPFHNVHRKMSLLLVGSRMKKDLTY